MKLSAHDNYGDLMTVEEFASNVANGLFIDYDGMGVLATKDQQSDIYIKPSTFGKLLQQNTWATHVRWYNR